jgi:FKBP-type peptidyl-prolyl cis-trans isomerase SlyD
VQPIAIADGSVVTIHYTLTLEDGQIVDSSSGHEPLAYLQGHGNIVPGLEEQLLGRVAGDELEAIVQPADGYGEFDPEGEQQVPRDAFPKGARLDPGMMFHTEDDDGNVQPLWVKAVAGAEVTVTANHPLAGRTLHFKVRIVGVRKGTSEEIEHGHPHGPGGHHH